MSHVNKNLLESIVERLLSHLTAKQQVGVISKQFSVLETNAERVDFAYRLLDEHQLFPKYVLDQKNNDLAGKVRQKGNEMFKLRKNAKAIEFYTQCVALAEDKSEHLALAYANRSAVLFEQGFYGECLMDIDRAFKVNYPENLKPKLLLRQEKAKQLQPKQVPLKYFQPMPKIPEEHVNKLIQCAADSVEIKDTEDQGRHVVATRDISIGEVIAIEKPFCHILIEQFYSNCHNCLNLCYNLIPCPKCTQTLYCSEGCRDKAVVYHQYECTILATVRKMKMDKLKLLPLKIALLVKDQYPNITENCSVEKIYRSDRYKEIHNLVANTSRRSVSDLFNRSCTAAVIYHLIKEYSHFFKTEEEETVFKELVLLHMQTGACNFHEISELAENSEGIYEPHEIGAGAYSFLSMFNHRCSANVVRESYGTAIVVSAIETIKKGQQCYDNYGYHHAVMPRSVRQAKLKEQYYFDCTCDVCENDWPLYANLPHINTGISISEGDLSKLQSGDVEAAKRILKEMLPKLKELERLKPCWDFSAIQEIVKQCIALQANVKKTL